MYRINASKSVGPTENAPYPRCQAKPSSSTDCVFTHFEDDVFNSSTNSATVTVREILTARCT